MLKSIFSWKKKTYDLTNEDKNLCLKQIYDLFSNTKDPNIIKDYEELFPLDEEDNQLYSIKLGEEIGRISAFEIKKNDILNIEDFDSEIKAKQSIINKVVNYKIRDNGKNDLGHFFTQQMKYNSNQWSKYDLLVSQSNEISTLSVFTKKFNSRFVNIYFITIKRVKYPYKSFILINKSENPYNPFNNFYSMEVYRYDYHFQIIRNAKKQYKIVSNDDDKYIHKYKGTLVKYYSILSYYAISNKMQERFTLPFEYFYKNSY